MTHLEDFERMLRDAGVGFKRMRYGDEGTRGQSAFLDLADEPAHLIRLGDPDLSDVALVGGYTGFYTDFYFGDDGWLLGVGVWE